MRISYGDLNKFENELNTYKFKKIRIGSLIPHYLRVDLNNPIPIYNYIYQSIFYLKNLFSFNKNLKTFNTDNYKSSIGLPFLTFISDRDHLFNILYPIFLRIGSENVFCIIRDKNVLKKFEVKPINYCLLSELPNVNYVEWKSEFSVLWRKIKNPIKNFISSTGVKKSYTLNIKNYLFIETRLIISYERLLKFLKPPFILTEHDRFKNISSLISVGNVCSIKTYSMMHGVINDIQGYTPLIANKIFVWGNLQKAQLTSYGIREKKIVVTGATQLEKTIVGNKLLIKNKLGLRKESIVLVLSTNNIEKKNRHKLAQIFCEMINNLSNDKFYGLIKIHPSESIKFYQPYLSNNVLIDKDNVLTQSDYFCLADAVCNYNSAFFVESINREIPVFTINVKEDKSNLTFQYCNKFKLPISNNSHDLSITISKYFNDIDFQDSLKNKIKKISSNFCISSGHEVVDKIIKLIENDI